MVLLVTPLCVPAGVDAARERLEPRWVLEFDAKPSSSWTEREPQRMTHMEECWAMCRRMMAQGLVIKHHVSKDNSKLIITVGANPAELRKEAVRVKLPMRMQDTMGMSPFSEDASEAALRNLVAETAEKHHLGEGKVAALREECADLPSHDLAKKALGLGCAQIDVQEALDAGLYVYTPNGTPFSSAQEQQLVMSRINQGLLIPLEARMRLPTRADSLNQLDFKLITKQPVSAKFLAQMLTTFGAYVVDAKGQYQQAQRIGPMCVKVAKLTEIDRNADGRGPWFVVHDPTAPVSDIETEVLKKIGFGDKHSRHRQQKDLVQLQTLRYQARSETDGVSYQPMKWRDLRDLLVWRTNPLWSHLYIKPIILPRQARDKHKKTLKKEWRFSQDELKDWVECADGKHERFSHTLIRCENKTPFWSHLCIKMIILPKHARDTHRENSKKGPFFRTATFPLTTMTSLNSLNPAGRRSTSSSRAVCGCAITRTATLRARCTIPTASSTLTRRGSRSSGAENASFESLQHTKAMILPRRALDKHKETLKREAFSAGCCGSSQLTRSATILATRLGCILRGWACIPGASPFRQSLVCWRWCSESTPVEPQTLTRTT